MTAFGHGRRSAATGATNVLILYVVLLVGIPSELVVHPLGAAGTPAQILGIGLLLWWVASRVVAGRVDERANPVKWLTLVFVLALLASYIAGMSRPISDALEVNSSDRALLSLAAWCGVVVVTADGIPSRARLDTLLRVLAGGATVVALLGMAQFFLDIDIAHLFPIPGLTANHAFGGAIERSDFRRVTGTTQHPIEFGVVLSATLPLLIHFARFSDTAGSRRRWWIASAVVAAALPMSVARSAIIGAAIALAFLFHTWPGRLKVQAMIAGIAGMGGLALAVPGLLGTIKSLFLNASSDPSTQGRTDDYGPVARYFEQRPWFGRGIGTFIPDLYRTLDNQYLGLSVEAGVVGVAAMLVVLFGSACVAGAVRRRTPVESTRNLAQSLKAGVVVIAVNAATFDAFGFAMCAGVLFLLIGAIASLRRLHPPLVTQGSSVTRQRVAQGAVVLALLGWGAGAFAALHAKPQFTAYGQVVLLPRGSAANTSLNQSGRAEVATNVLHSVLESDQARAALAREGASDYEAAVGDGSLMMGTDVAGTGGPTLRFSATAATAAAAERNLRDVVAYADAQLTRLQDDVAVPRSERITLAKIALAPASYVAGRPTRARAALVLLLALIAGAGDRLVRSTRPRCGDAASWTPVMPPALLPEPEMAQ